jgi:predicted MPP superfamily phosphohydrolase
VRIVVIALVAIRIVTDALVARFALSAPGRGFWRAFGATIVADAAVALVSPPLIYWMASRSEGSPVHRTFATAAAGVGVLAVMLFIWGAAMWLIARPRPRRFARAGGVALVLCVTALAELCALGFVQEQTNAPARVTVWDVRVNDLPVSFHNLRVCCIGDLHLHRAADRGVISERLRAVAALKPDLILFVGDYASNSEYESDAAAFIAQQHAPLGVYAVLGNHDRWVGQERSLRALRRAGVRVLVNENIILRRHDGSAISLAGVNDPYTGGADLDAALKGVPRGACVIVMSHSPDIITQAKARGVSLVVAGHTHGGQIVVPFIGPPVVLSRFGKEYAHGLFYRGNTAMFVTRGVGEIFPYVRLNCPREIAVLRLVRRK